MMHQNKEQKVSGRQQKRTKVAINKEELLVKVIIENPKDHPLILLDNTENRINDKSLEIQRLC